MASAALGQLTTRTSYPQQPQVRQSDLFFLNLRIRCLVAHPIRVTPMLVSGHHWPSYALPTSATEEDVR